MNRLKLAYPFLYLHKMRHSKIAGFSLLAFIMMQSIVYAQKDSVAANSKDQNSNISKTEELYSITITVTNIRNNKGTIRFKFYDDTTPFPHDTGFLKIVVNKSEVVNGVFTHTYTGFKSQNMGIALLDDEDNDNELEMGWFFPKEGHAFSDYYHSALRKPLYSDFRFFLSGDKTVIMKMKYY